MAQSLGLKIARPLTQGSSRLATLGWRTQSLWDCRFENAPKAEGRRKSEGRRSKAERRPKSEGRRPKQIRTALGLGFRFSDFGPRPSFGLRVADFKANRSGGGGLTEKWGGKNIRRNPIFLSACSQKELCGLSLSYCPIPRHSDLFSPRSHFVAAGRSWVSNFGFRPSAFGLRTSKSSVFGSRVWSGPD